MDDVDRLAAVLSGRVAVLTGAGCSTESGIPDYRGPGTRERARKPVQHRQFVDDPAWRQRYWARAVVGWSRVAGAAPNPAHEALAAWEASGGLCGLITQNVDGLHQQAGSRDVVELHGSLGRVICLRCGRTEARGELQVRLDQLNPGWSDRVAEVAPDGDADVDGVEGFRVADCLACGGVLKPDVVFFGDSVPRDRVAGAARCVEESDALLVVGSSLVVFSGFRFVKQAHGAGKPVAILALGETRGDPLATVKVDGRAGEVLPRLVARLRGQEADRPLLAHP